ncbi:ABC transporter permease subunit [Cytobacillus firmus]
MRFLSWIKKHALFCLGTFLLLLLLAITFAGPYLPFVDRELTTITYILNEDKKPVIPPYPPSEDYIFGTDKSGRDLLSLIILGAKETILLVACITVLRYVLAIPLSFLAHKKWLGTHLLLKWLNGLLSYIPTIIIVMLLAMLPPFLLSEYRPLFLLLIIALAEMPRAAEMIKLEFDQISSKEYIYGGIAAGASPYRLFRIYYLPLLYSKLLVYMVTDLGKVMFLLGQLGFVGIFISQDIVQSMTGDWQLVNNSISWPMMMIKAFEDIRGPIWIPFFSAFAMTYAILTFNIFAEGLKSFFTRKVRYI